MARRRRRTRQNPVRKYARMALSGFGKLVGGITIASPGIVAWQESGGDLQTFSNRVKYRYTGLTAAGTVDWTATAGGVSAIIGGIAIAKLFSIAAKHF